MDIGDAALVGTALAVALAAVRLAEKGIGKLRRNGNGGHHPYENARSNAKLDTIATLQRESIAVQTRGFDKLCMMREVDSERHHSVLSQLDRIEKAIDD